MSHILFIPSWYPRDADDLNGSFFQEQAVAIRDSGHKVGIALVDPVYSYKWLQHRVHRKRLISVGKDKLPVVRADVLMPPPGLYRLLSGNLKNIAWEVFTTYQERFGTPDVMHVHTALPAVLMAHEIFLRTKIPYVLTEHRRFTLTLRRNGTRWNEICKGIRSASLRSSVSLGLSQDLEDYFGPEQGNWEVSSNLLPTSFELSEVIPYRDSPVVFGHVSTLTPIKNVTGLIESFCEHVVGHNDVRLKIIGGGSDLTEFQNLASRTGHAEKIEFTGPLNREETLKALHEVDIFVLPSKLEPFGVVLIEALALGIPVISTKTWGGKGIVLPEDGLLVPIDDTDALGKAMVQMLQHRREYPALELKKRCIERFGKSAFVSLWNERYDQVLSLRSI